MKPAKKVIQHKFQIGIEDHLFIMIERPERPTISLDFWNCHGRADLGVRVDGMGIASLLCDVKELGPKSKLPLARYCPMCGEMLNHASSRGHVCPDEPLRKFGLKGTIQLEFQLGHTKAFGDFDRMCCGYLETDGKRIWFKTSGSKLATITPASAIDLWLAQGLIEEFPPSNDAD